MVRGKYRFRAACEAMLLQLGAKPTASGWLELDTVAGVLCCKPHAEWLACRFKEPWRAQQLGIIDADDRGRWNHHYTRPGVQHVEQLRAKMQTILP